MSQTVRHRPDHRFARPTGAAPCGFAAVRHAAAHAVEAVFGCGCLASRRSRLTGAGFAFLLLTGCGGPAEVDVPELDPEDAAACEAFAGALPDTLADEERVDIEPSDAPAGAYGDPAIIVTCGVGSPEGFGPGARCELVNDVPWYIPSEQYDDLDLDLVITSAWHAPRVQVVMPAEHRGNALEAGIMAKLSPLVADHLRETGKCDL